MLVHSPASEHGPENLMCYCNPREQEVEMLYVRALHCCVIAMRRFFSPGLMSWERDL